MFFIRNFLLELVRIRNCCGKLSTTYCAKTNNKLSTPELLSDGKRLSEPLDVSSHFNEHFANVGNKVQSSIERDTNVIMNGKLIEVPRVVKNVKFGRVTELQLCKIVDRLKPKRSTGPDGISNVLLKRLIHVVKGPLCVIINRSLQMGRFPDLLKLARVIPLFKGGDSLMADNYRPYLPSSSDFKGF